MVGGLVEQQQVGASEQQLGQRDAHLPAAGKGLSRPVGVVGAEAESAQHGGDAQVHAVAVRQAEAVLQVGIAVEHRLVIGVRHAGVAQAVLDVVHLRLHVQERLEGAARFLEHRPARVGQAVLRQVADGEARRFDDGARVRVLEAGQHLEQGGLAGAVRAAEADTVAVPDLPGDVFEQRADPEGLGDVGELNQGIS